MTDIEISIPSVQHRPGLFTFQCGDGGLIIVCEFAGSGVEMIYTPVISTDPYTVCVLGRSNVGNIIRYQTVRVLRIILIGSEGL